MGRVSHISSGPSSLKRRSPRPRTPRGNVWRLDRPGSGGRTITRRQQQRTQRAPEKPTAIQFTDATIEEIVWQIVNQDAEYIGQDVNGRAIYFVHVTSGKTIHRLLVSSFIEGVMNPTATIRVMNKETVEAVSTWTATPSKEGVCDCDFQHFHKSSFKYNAARLRDRMTRAKAG